MLDTNICIYIIKKKPPTIIKKFKKNQNKEIGISSITFSELQYGVFKSQFIEKNQTALSQFTSVLKVFPYDDKAAIAYGEIRTALEFHGLVIGPLDMLIAAHAKSLNAQLVSNNIVEFKCVEGLRLDNWFS